MRLNNPPIVGNWESLSLSILNRRYGFKFWLGMWVYCYLYGQEARLEGISVWALCWVWRLAESSKVFRPHFYKFLAGEINALFVSLLTLKLKTLQSSIVDCSDKRVWLLLQLCQTGLDRLSVLRLLHKIALNASKLFNRLSQTKRFRIRFFGCWQLYVLALLLSSCLISASSLVHFRNPTFLFVELRIGVEIFIGQLLLNRPVRCLSFTGPPQRSRVTHILLLLRTSGW